jgi:hypothetical protein|tara:strand:- start:1116 stop:1922 length:807 start_codon:yes stop_codon:yes gene_type:complete
MTYLSRELIRRMIIAEARKKAPLLPGGGVNFGDDDQTDDLTLSNIELTEPVDITYDTPIAHVPPPPEEEAMPTDLRFLYDFGDDEEYSDDDDLPGPYDDEVTDPDVDISKLRGFDGEEYTDEDFDPAKDVKHFVRDRADREKFLHDKVSPHDPAGRTYGQIESDVDEIYRKHYKPPTKKSESAEEEEFLRKMHDMIAAGAAAADFPDDPEFAPEDTAELPDDTLELPMDRFNKDNSDDGDDSLEETISRLIRESISKKVKLISKNNRY